MAQAASRNIDDDNIPSKRELQQDMQKTRESVAETVDEIKETVG